jgi:hypothetical protein
MLVRVSFLTFAVAGLAGCALPRPPADTAPYTRDCIFKAPLVEHSYLFATTRLPDCRTAAHTVTPFRADGLSFGTFGTDGIHFYDPAQWKEQVRARIATGPAPILYIHGFNNSNLAAITRAAAIRHATGREVIVLTWPSYDKTLKYFWDEANMGWSMPYARQLFADLTSIRPDLTIVAHSMGNHLALDMVRSWKIAHRDQKVPIERLIMAAPDVDRRWFIDTVAPELGVELTLYASTRDQPLSASWRSHGYARAGDLSKWVTGTGNAYPYDKLPQVTVVDTSLVSAGIGHADFIETSQGAADLCRIVNAPATDPAAGRRRDGAHSNSWLLLKLPAPADQCAEPGRYGASIATGKWRSRRPGA